MSYQQLTEGKRYQISALLAKEHSKAAIARVLNVHPATISRELARNGSKQGYDPKQAQALATQRKQNAAKYTVNKCTVIFIEWMLERQWSPEQISHIANKIDISVSHEWIYQYVAQDKANGGTLYTHLRQGHKKYRKGKYKKRRSPIVNAVSIDERPEIVDSRERLGDWEADTVIGKRGTGVFVTLAERKTRFYLVKRVDSKQADVVKDALIAMLKPYKDFVHTITFDNGGEFAKHEAVADALDANAYFSHPYSSFERGLNENFNGLLRQYFPKGMDLSEVTEEEVKAVQERLNLRPRKCLGYKQPKVVLEELRQAA
ncbi:IS30 family transposase [uncultured Shewanella sp.]|uniref:IS30 family transposase n=1 Tax=uncultured Shewanella sp. TaxID=173975 RepID=UPI00261697E7|nr:IS30 family transposase [uncultured Shewanella sp.]